MTALTTHTLGDGAETLTYDVHGDLAAATAERPPLFLIGSPMDAVGFGSLAARLTDRPVVTYDPRGGGRNPAGTGEVTPELHAADLHRVVEALGVGPVDAFGSSGGAVNLLRLAELHPDDLRRVVAHEPPTVVLLPDAEPAMAAVHSIPRTYAESGEGPAMVKFIAIVSHQGLVPVGLLDGPQPDPATFGMSAEDDGARGNLLMRNMPSCQAYTPDVAALSTFGDRLVVAVGGESGEELAARGGRSVAAALGVAPVVFPGGHGGFMGGEHGQPAGDPDGFADVLRGLLDG